MQTVIDKLQEALKLCDTTLNGDSADSLMLTLVLGDLRGVIEETLKILSE